jgi:hypothetical protein
VALQREKSSVTECKASQMTLLWIFTHTEKGSRQYFTGGEGIPTPTHTHTHTQGFVFLPKLTPTLPSFTQAAASSVTLRSNPVGEYSR